MTDKLKAILEGMGGSEVEVGLCGTGYLMVSPDGIKRIDSIDVLDIDITEAGG